MKESDILYENATHWIARNPRKGFDVYKNGITHSTRVAIFGSDGDEWFQRAKADADRRNAAA